MFFLLAFLFISLFFERKKRFFTFEQVEGNARDGRSRRQSFRVRKVNLATLKVGPTNKEKTPASQGAKADTINHADLLRQTCSGDPAIGENEPAEQLS